MKTFWDERFGDTEYVYGTEANHFLQEILPTLPKGSILFPAEGEGRNSVYAATLGFEVHAFDFSEKGREKALRLALEKSVSIDYIISDFDSFDTELRFDYIALIYAHAPAGKRCEYHRKMIHLLKPGGTIIIEAFNKNQINKSSGGPKDLEMLFSLQELREDFKGMIDLEITEMDVTLNEGPFHQGEASIIRLVGKKSNWSTI